MKIKRNTLKFLLVRQRILICILISLSTRIAFIVKEVSKEKKLFSEKLNDKKRFFGVGIQQATNDQINKEPEDWQMSI